MDLTTLSKTGITDNTVSSLIKSTNKWEITTQRWKITKTRNTTLSKLVPNSLQDSFMEVKLDNSTQASLLGALTKKTWLTELSIKLIWK